jgi:hypothetical protein
MSIIYHNLVQFNARVGASFIYHCPSHLPPLDRTGLFLPHEVPHIVIFLVHDLREIIQYKCQRAGMARKRGMLSNKRYFYGMRAYGQIMGQWRTPLRDLSAVVVYFFNARPPGDCFGQRRYSQISLAHLIVADRFTAVTHRGAQQQGYGSLTRLIWKNAMPLESKKI